MWQRHVRSIVVLTCAAAMTVVSHCRASDETGWRAGAAVAKITPQEPMWMAGYASRDKPASGTLTDLWAKALVLQDSNGHQGVVVTLDLVGIDRELSRSICRQLQERYQLERDQIVLSTSHTHTGPVVGRNLWPMHVALLDAEQKRQVEAYTVFLEAQIVEVVGRARETMQSVRLRAGQDRATFAVNRRNNPEAEVPARRSAETLIGPVDHSVPVLAIDRFDGSLMAVLFGYACHATVLDSFEWSGDYPGFAQQRLAEELPGTVALFWAGCGADQNPLPRRQVSLARDYGRQLADAVLRALRGDMTSVNGPLTTTYKEIDLPLDALPTKDQLQRDVNEGNRYAAARARRLLEQIERGQPLSPVYPYPLSVWQFGDQLTWYHLGGEVVVDYALRIKSDQPDGIVWVAGYCHDVMAYIPSRRVWHEGGYEGASAMVYYGLPSRWAESVEDIIMSSVREARETVHPRASPSPLERAEPGRGDG